jgi:hypothetical protein
MRRKPNSNFSPHVKVNLIIMELCILNLKICRVKEDEIEFREIKANTQKGKFKGDDTLQRSQILKDFGKYGREGKILFISLRRKGFSLSF